MKNVLKNQMSHSEAEQLASLLDAMIDEELARPPEEQDIRAVAEWSAMLDTVTSGAYRPGRREKQALLRSLRSRTRKAAEKRTPTRRRKIALPIAAALAVLVLSVSAYAGRELSWVEKIFLQHKTEINALDEGESITFHEENRDLMIVKGEGWEYDSVQSFVNASEHTVLWPSWLPDGIESERILLIDGDNRYIYLIPDTDGFMFCSVEEGELRLWPESRTVTLRGQETEFRYYLEDAGATGDNGGHGCFLYRGDLYVLGFRSLDEAEVFIDSLYAVMPQCTE